MADYATLLRDHMTWRAGRWTGFSCRGMCRICSRRAGVPVLALAARFPIPSSAAFGKIGKAYESDQASPRPTGSR